MGPVHSLLRDHRHCALCLGVIGLTGCFDPEVTHNNGEESTGGSESGTVETTLETTSPTSATSPDTTVETTTPADSSSDTAPPECRTEADCPAPDECHVVTCDDGMCVDAPVDAGTPCGDDTVAECNAADSCDGDGNCVENVAPNGSTCTGCALGQCSCNDGACGDCSFAPTNNFITTRSIAGWELTGGWALYREAPQSASAPAIPFEGQVLGTDGNRSSPYPGGEQEDSYARSPVTTLPATLDFLSWHVDEGSGYDNKSIAVSIDDGVSWVVVADCTINAGLAFCMNLSDRAPDAWDSISIPVPPDMVGERGLVELRYNSGDGCCQFERGWFVDVANFATECACGDDAVCSKLGGECGPGVCGGGGECELDAIAAGMACGDATDVECDAPDACDGFGYCAGNVVANGLSACHDCPSGDTCQLWCEQGLCSDCASALITNDFATGFATFGWTTESLDGTGNGWGIYNQAPPRAEAGSLPIAFSTAPVWGTDGNRVSPYDLANPPNNSETENSQFTTYPDTVPDTITFDSWHQDEGGASTYDAKTIQLSVDDGASWDVLVDCATADQGLFPFCASFTSDRAGDDWNPITIDTAAYAGMVGRLRFTYSTIDSAGTFERGWYIDNLSFAQSCNDPQFP
jgi:hypothetical protein